MKIEEIRETILRIISQTDIKDLDIEDGERDILPEKPNQIGLFFFFDNKLYTGAFAGAPNYVYIGLYDELKTIMYRYFPEDGCLSFVFDFGKYRVAVDHEEYRDQAVSIFHCASDEWVIYDKDISKYNSLIQSTIKEIMEDKYVPEKEEDK